MVSALTPDVWPMALMTWVPTCPGVEGTLATQENVPSPAAVVAHRLTVAGDTRPVSYLTFTLSPAENPPPVMVRAIPDDPWLGEVTTSLAAVTCPRLLPSLNQTVPSGPVVTAETLLSRGWFAPY